MIFLLPSEKFNLSKVDYDFRDEYNSISTLGYQVYLFDYFNFITSGEFTSNFDFKKRSQIVVLRSKHLKFCEYQKLWEFLDTRGFNLVNNPDQYSICHHFPKFYGYFGDYCPKSVWTEDLSDESVLSLRQKIGGDFVIKDYSKIDQDFRDNSIVYKGTLNEEFLRLFHKFRENRAQFINVGIVLKELLQLKEYNGDINKWRLFFLNQKLISVDNHSGLSRMDCPEISNIKQLAQNVPSNFFSLDLVELYSGEWKVLDGDDGSQSQLSKNLNELVFYMNFLDFDKNEKL